LGKPGLLLGIPNWDVFWEDSEILVWLWCCCCRFRAWMLWLSNVLASDLSGMARAVNAMHSHSRHFKSAFIAMLMMAGPAGLSW
jgi:hypothetical protein